MIYITDYVDSPDIERSILGEKLNSFTDEVDNKSQAKVLLVWHFQVNEESLKEFPQVKAIVRYGVGFDNIDLDICKSKSIEVFNNPDYGVDEVSDTALGMIMNLGRNISVYNSKSKQLLRDKSQDLDWQENTNRNALRFKDCSIGIIGMGRIGSTVCLKMRNIIGSIKFYDPYVQPGYEKVMGCEREESLEALLESSDIVSLHLPLSENTQGMVDDLFINKMKMGSIFINTARGGFVSSLDCLFKGLESGRLNGVGLDVLPEEPPVESISDPLLVNWLDERSEYKDKIIINPHTAYYSPQSYNEMRQKAALMSLNALEGNQKQNRII